MIFQGAKIRRSSETFYPVTKVTFSSDVFCLQIDCYLLRGQSISCKISLYYSSTAYYIFMVLLLVLYAYINTFGYDLMSKIPDFILF